ncbi:hypothetical protein [Streptomyces sp. NPDC056663]|uniref:hypothetical protein n=1 Tax=Streptomyces sp. NPDC056663 TaxID=3345899 RepID=UPI00368A11F8
MDPEIAALAGTAGTALVSLLTTEAWQSAREGLVAIWRRVRPERAETVSAELEATRHDLLSARDEGDQETAAELEADWQGRIRRLLRTHPEVADELRALLVESAPQPPAPSGPIQHATASGHSRIYQAGRDMHLGQQ